jgi:hypothetical protein
VVVDYDLNFCLGLTFQYFCKAVEFEWIFVCVYKSNNLTLILMVVSIMVVWFRF